jgi:ribokinase
VVGSVNTDLTFTVGALPRRGETVLASSLATSPGGKGANQAIAAARAGAQVQFVGAVGGDRAAEELLAHLRANNVGTDAVMTLPGPSGTAVIAVDAHAENIIVVAPGANGRLTIDSAGAREVIADCDVLLLQLEIPVGTAVATARAAHAAGATVIVNASPASAGTPELADLAALADVVVVNESEATQWQWPVAHRVITRGAHGASYVGQDDQFDVSAPAVEAVDTTGAGGVLAAGWAADRKLALRRASAAGALATLVPGAGDCAPSNDAIDDALTAD